MHHRSSSFTISDNHHQGFGYCSLTPPPPNRYHSSPASLPPPPQPPSSRDNRSLWCYNNNKNSNNGGGINNRSLSYTNAIRPVIPFYWIPALIIFSLALLFIIYDFIAFFDLDQQTNNIYCSKWFAYAQVVHYPSTATIDHHQNNDPNLHYNNNPQLIQQQQQALLYYQQQQQQQLQQQQYYHHNPHQYQHQHSQHQPHIHYYSSNPTDYYHHYSIPHSSQHAAGGIASTMVNDHYATASIPTYSDYSHTMTVMDDHHHYQPSHMSTDIYYDEYHQPIYQYRNAPPSPSSPIDSPPLSPSIPSEEQIKPKISLNNLPMPTMHTPTPSTISSSSSNNDSSSSSPSISDFSLHPPNPPSSSSPPSLSSSPSPSLSSSIASPAQIASDIREAHLNELSSNEALHQLIYQNRSNLLLLSDRHRYFLTSPSIISTPFRRLHCSTIYPFIKLLTMIVMICNIFLLLLSLMIFRRLERRIQEKISKEQQRRLDRQRGIRQPSGSTTMDMMINDNNNNNNNHDTDTDMMNSDDDIEYEENDDKYEARIKIDRRMRYSFMAIWCALIIIIGVVAFIRLRSTYKRLSKIN